MGARPRATAVLVRHALANQALTAAAVSAPCWAIAGVPILSLV
jgi:hypothetical protein